MTIRPGNLITHLTGLAVAGTLAAGCVGGAGASSSAASAPPTQPALELPADGDTLLVQVRTEGGFVAPSFRFAALPQLSVYADGRLIEQGAVPEIYPGPLLPALLVRRLSAAQLRDILAEAEASGLTPDAERTSFPPHGIADAPDTVIVVWSPAGPRTTSIGAFGMEQGAMDPGEAAARAAAATFIERVQALPGSNEAPFTPTAARVIARPYVEPDPAVSTPPVAWPLATPLASGMPLVEGAPLEGRCLVVSGSDLATLWPLFASANAATGWLSDGVSYALIVRPLLPDEPATCG